MPSLIGNKPNQVPTNGDLGTLAFQDANAVQITGGIVDVSAGTAALPTLGTSGDPDTGFWFPAANTIAASTNGVERLRIDSSGAVFITATAASSDSLNANGFRFGSGTFKQQFSTGFDFQQYYISAGQAAPDASVTVPAANSYSIKTNQTERMRIDSAGRVLVNNSSSYNNSSRFQVTSINIGVDNGAGGQAIMAMTSDAFAADRGASIGLGGKASGEGNIVFGAIAGRSEGTGNAGYLQFATINSGGTMSERMRITSTGNVGIGTTSPVHQLQVNGAGDTDIKLTTSNTGSTATDGLLLRINSTGSEAYLWQYEAGALIFGTSATERMRITSAGNVGIGTSSPTQALSIARGAGVGAGIEMAGNGATLGTGSVFVGQGNDGVYYIYQRANNNMLFGTNNTERMRLDFSGNLGLGVTPSAWNTGVRRVMQFGADGFIAGTQSTAGFAELGANAYLDSGSTERYINSSFASKYRQLSGVHSWYTAPSGTAGNAITFTQAMTLDASGNLGIGTTAPSYRLDLVDSTSNQIKLGAGGTGHYLIGRNTSSGLLAFYGQQTGFTGYVFGGIDGERMRIDSSGNVGIGTSSPSSYGQLAVYKSSGDVEAAVVTDGASYATYRVQNSSRRYSMQIRTDQSNAWALRDETAGANRLLVNTSGDFQFNSGYGSVATAYGCRAWVNFNGTGTVAIRASGNVSSITDNGTGNYTVNLTTAMPDANYSWFVSGGRTANTGNPANLTSAAPTTSALRFNTTDSAFNVVDHDFIAVGIFR